MFRPQRREPLWYTLNRAGEIRPEHIHNMVRKGVNLNERNTFQETILCDLFNLEKATPEIIITLVELGFEINSQSRAEGKAPFHALCKSRQINSVLIETMVDQGADINIGDLNGDRPFHELAYNESISPEIIHTMVAQEADINISNNFGDRPIHSLCYNERFVPSLDLIAAMVEQGAELNVQNDWGKRPFDQIAGVGIADIQSWTAQFPEGLTPFEIRHPGFHH